VERGEEERENVVLILSFAVKKQGAVEAESLPSLLLSGFNSL
jgi:hypothetical protein